MEPDQILSKRLADVETRLTALEDKVRAYMRGLLAADKRIDAIEALPRMPDAESKR